LIKSDSKEIYNATNDFSFKLKPLSLHQKNPEKKNLSWFSQKYEGAQLF